MAKRKPRMIRVRYVSPEALDVLSTFDSANKNIQQFEQEFRSTILNNPSDYPGLKRKRRRK